MAITQTNQQGSRKPLRLWPGVVAAVLLVVVGVVSSMIGPNATLFGMSIVANALISSAVAAVAIVLWWTFFSRAPWSERLGALALMIVAGIATHPLLDESIAGAGMGSLFFFYSVQTMGLALVVWAVATRHLRAGPRRALMIAAILLGSGMWALVRTGGVTGEVKSDFHWRWTLSPEERLLAQARDDIPAPIAPETPAATPSAAAPAPTPEEPAPAPAANASAPDRAKAAEKKPEAGPAPEVSADPTVPKREPEWNGFRGPNRDSVVRGSPIKTDWTGSAPVELWRRPIGPGWSSFSVDGDVIYTQEQRGEEELVSAYNLKTGAPVWRHRDPVRFYESNGGPGPRGTPTLANGRVYALGATGVLNALKARDGSRIWSKNAAADTEVTVPEWGVSSSPLVIDDIVIVAVSGRLVAYDAATGERRWLGPTGGAGYSSPHLLTIDGVPQVMLLRGSRTISVAPEDGKLLWEHTWEPGGTIVQPAMGPDGDVLISLSNMSGIGMKRLAVSKGLSGWNVQEKWTSTGLKPYFNDYVVHEGHAYGFDGSILSCIDLNDGARKWKGGRYGFGQMILLADQDLLLVLSEEGDLALVSATPDKYTEVAKFKVLDAKTWNHPVIVRDVLLVRNGEEMAAFRLPLAGR